MKLQTVYHTYNNSAFIPKTSQNTKDVLGICMQWSWMTTQLEILKTVFGKVMALCEISNVKGQRESTFSLRSYWEYLWCSFFKRFLWMWKRAWRRAKTVIAMNKYANERRGDFKWVKANVLSDTYCRWWVQYNTYMLRYNYQEMTVMLRQKVIELGKLYNTEPTDSEQTIFNPYKTSSHPCNLSLSHANGHSISCVSCKTQVHERQAL